MATMARPMPRTGQPDVRTKDEKVRRVQHLGRCISQANGLDIALKILDDVPLAISAFNFMVRGRAFHGYVRLLLRKALRATRNRALINDLGKRIPKLRTALQGNNVNAEARRKALVSVLLAEEPQQERSRIRRKYEIAVCQTLFRALHRKDKPWTRIICSGCLQCKRQGAMDGKHLFCKNCFPHWCASTGRYMSQQHVDEMWLGVHQLLSPEFEFKHAYSHDRSLAWYHTDVAQKLAIEVHGVSLDVHKERVSSMTPEIRIELAKNLCLYSLDRVRRPDHFAFASRDAMRNDILHSMEALYGHSMDVLGCNKIQYSIFSRCLKIEAAEPVAVETSLLVDGCNDDYHTEEITPGEIREIIARDHLHLPYRRATLLIVDELARQEMAYALSPDQANIKMCLTAWKRNERPSVGATLVPRMAFRRAVLKEYQKLIRNSRQHDWQDWLEFVNKATNQSSVIEWDDVADCVDRVWSTRGVHHHDRLLDLILHAAASSICHRHISSSAFLHRVRSIAGQYCIQYDLSYGNGPLTFLDSWMLRSVDYVSITCPQLAANMPSEGLMGVIAGKIFIYDQHMASYFGR